MIMIMVSMMMIMMTGDEGHVRDTYHLVVVVLQEARKVDEHALRCLRTEVADGGALGTDACAEHEVDREGRGELVALGREAAKRLQVAVELLRAERVRHALDALELGHACRLLTERNVRWRGRSGGRVQARGRECVSVSFESSLAIIDRCHHLRLKLKLTSFSSVRRRSM